MDIKLVIVKGAKKRQAIRIRSEETIVGRQKGCDLRIPSPLVSRRHCRLSFQDDGLVIEDLASANGSFVNGVRVDGQGSIRPGDLLEIGPITFRVEYGMAVSPQTKKLEDLPLAPEVAKAFAGADEEPIEYAELGEDEERLPQKKNYHDVIPLSDAEEAAAAAGGNLDGATELSDLSWQAPPQEKIRDILSQLENE
jgi:pSer/pThr/pTyr-binding forkhead associated (FHA) protein